jgi:hypothetical protein
MTMGDPERRYPRIPRGLYDQLLGVSPSVDAVVSPALTYRPCRVRLEEDTWLPRVYVQEARSWLELWGAWPDEDPGKTEVAIGEVVEIADSPVRLPAHLATRMYDAGESGVGGFRDREPCIAGLPILREMQRGCRFTLVLADGRRLGCETGNAIDFVDLPPGVSTSHVVDLHPHVRAGEPTTGAAYAWCLYELPPVG